MENRRSIMHGIISIQLREQELLGSSICQIRQFTMEQMGRCAMENKRSIMHGTILIQLRVRE